MLMLMERKYDSTFQAMQGRSLFEAVDPRFQTDFSIASAFRRLAAFSIQSMLRDGSRREGLAAVIDKYLE